MREGAVHVALLAFGDTTVGHFAFQGVEAFGQSRVLLSSFACAEVGDPHEVRERRVGESQRGGMRNSAGHVGDAVVHHSIDHVAGIGVRSGPGGFNAAALIDGDIHDDGALFHLRDHGACDDFGGGSARNEDSADHEVGFARGVREVVAVRCQRVDAAAEESSSSRRRFRLRSTSVTLAPKPRAIFAALVPTMPPPTMVTCAGGTPGTPPSRMPRPPCSFSR